MVSMVCATAIKERSAQSLGKAAELRRKVGLAWAASRPRSLAEEAAYCLIAAPGLSTLLFSRALVAAWT